MKLAKRIEQVKPSMTLAIDAKARELKAKGEDIISFGAGEPDFPTPDNIKKAGIDAINRNMTRYTPVSGTDEVKDAIIAKFKNENGLVYQRNELVVSCGAKQSFYNLAQVLWEAGDEIIIPAPYWVSYPEMTALADATPVIVETFAESGFKMTPEQFKAAITPRTRAVVINSPSNPTGSAYEKKELEALAEVALRHKILIISDEIYERIVFDGFQQVSIASLGEEVKRNCVVINGVSKTYSMTGWRIGYLAADKEIIAACNKLQGQSTSNPTSISQAATVEALLGPQDEIMRRVTEFQKRRDFLLKRLGEIPGVTCYKPVGTFYAFPDFSGLYGSKWGDESIDGSLALTDFLIEAARVALVPGIAFGADRNTRISFATSIEIISKGLDRIATAIATLK